MGTSIGTGLEEYITHDILRDAEFEEFYKARRRAQEIEPGVLDDGE